jgi:hypothetical protein
MVPPPVIGHMRLSFGPLLGYVQTGRIFNDKSTQIGTGDVS